jgi:hypothetical protein
MAAVGILTGILGMTIKRPIKKFTKIKIEDNSVIEDNGSKIKKSSFRKFLG